MMIDSFDLQKKVMIVAELSANHNQDFTIAVDTIRAAANAGVDAIKLQTYTPDTITLNCDNNYFKINHGTMWDGQTLYDLYKKAYTPWHWQPKLKEIAEEHGLIFFSSPFDHTSVDFLGKIGTSAYKIASPEITDIPLIEHVASKQKPIIISTGIANIEDIELAIETCKMQGNHEIILLKCTSAYPTPLEQVNLKNINYLKKKFSVNIGLSDHTLGINVALGAVALGARMIEKHFILDRTLGGPDASFSLEPDQMKQLVEGIRELERSLGEEKYILCKEMDKIRELSRSLFIVQDISKGDRFTKANLRSIRPGYGLHPRYYKDILGKKSNSSIKKGTPLKWEFVDQED